MLDLNDLLYFVHVVDRKGFTAAGKALNVPKSNLSRRVLKLEQALGVRLIQRSSRRFVVTEVGAEFYQHCRAMMIEAEEAENAIRRRRAEPVGRVRFSCPPVLGQYVVADLLPTFIRRNPRVQIIERLTSGTVDLSDDEFDVALRVHARPLEGSSLVQRTICRIQLILVASPAFLDTMGRPQEPDDLQDAAGLARDISFERSSWNLERESGGQAEIPFKPVFCSNDWATLCRIAVAGVGIAALPTHVCRKEVSCGALERVLPTWRADYATLTLLQPSRRGTLPSVRAFVDFMVRELPTAIS
jgi:DNA-binding transcriptional LysR family regulator